MVDTGWIRKHRSGDSCEHKTAPHGSNWDRVRCNKEILLRFIYQPTNQPTNQLTNCAQLNVFFKSCVFTTCLEINQNEQIIFFLLIPCQLCWKKSDKCFLEIFILKTFVMTPWHILCNLGSLCLFGQDSPLTWKRSQRGKFRNSELPLWQLRGFPISSFVESQKTGFESGS